MTAASNDGDDDAAAAASHEADLKAGVPSASSASTPGLFRSEIETASHPASSESLVNQTFGNYEVLEEIARGGMGVVVRAREKKLKRIVALKMILGGQLADESDIKRFYIEAEAAAALHHPGIVPIYEVGSVDGQHFYSMQLVEGPSLTDRVRKGPLPPRQAAELMLQIGHAVQFAHENNIIHRDLKPENVLLNASGRPMVTDFGLAKSIDSGDNLTQSGQILGTPGYMSPEQALGRIDLQGPGVDIYSLGAILYFLLTGRPPFQAASTLETLDQVVKQMPVSPRDLNAAVPRDIETICLKCLAKDPRQRYFSAKSLADDLQRFLNGMPVMARPAGTATRLWRWCLRNPAVAALSAAVILSLIAGTTFSTQYALLARRRANEAEREREAAQRNFSLAREAVDRYFTRVSEDTLLNQPGMQHLQKQLLRDALEYYQQFVSQRADDDSAREELASALFRVGIIEEAVGANLENSRDNLLHAKRIQEEILQSNPADLQTQRNLADTVNALCRIYLKTNDADKALSAAERSLELRQSAWNSQPDDLELQRLVASSQMNLGLVHREQGNLQPAASAIKQAQELRRDLLQQTSPPRVQRDLGMGYYNLGNIALDAGDVQTASTMVAQAITAFETAVDQSPEDFRNRRLLALCLQLQGDLIAEAGRVEDAIESYRTGVRELRFLAQRNPEVTVYRFDLAVALMNLGSLLRESEDVASASETLDHAIAEFEQLISSGQSNESSLLLADAKLRKAFVLIDAGQTPQAVLLLRQLLRLPDEATEDFQRDTAAFEELISIAQQTLDDLPIP
ncbi:MAG: serine/threonine-protein kinase [Fuerstiella sp.]